jgi:para-aminobenzoate synthetase/4-amino-4-deoxychorismate lyase
VRAAPWAAHFGLARTPFGKSIAARDLFARQAHAEAIARISFCVVESALGVVTGDVGAGKTVALRFAEGPPVRQACRIASETFGRRSSCRVWAADCCVGGGELRRALTRPAAGGCWLIHWRDIVVRCFGGKVRPGSAPRVVRRPLGWDLAPVEVLRLVRSDAHPVALIGAWADGSDVISSEPVLVRSPPQSLADVLDSPCAPGAGSGGGAGGHAEHARQLRAGLADPAFPGFGGGWIGYLGFGFGGEVLPVPPAPGGPRHLPAWWFGYYDHVLRRDQSTGEWFFEALWTAGRDEALERRFEDLSGRPRGPAPSARGYCCGDFLLAPPAAEHKAAVSRAVEYIRRGDIFQANICLRLEAGFDGDPLDAFCQAVTVLQPPYAAFMRVSGGAVCSLSPELFLRRKGSTVLSRPVKGTHRRSPCQRRARRQRGELERSAKNRAENVMIVDLMRNDLSRVCAAGSVEVPRLLSVEPHPGVWHLVSDVRGTLGARAGDGDLIRATFPPGSVTGAPKVRAVEIIHELEATPREIYTGAVGYRSPVAGLELNVAIRAARAGR